jgi:hypothetical protein
MSPDEVCARYFEKGVRLTVAELDEETILIEGSREGLRFLGELLIAQADFEKDDGFQISPFGAGHGLFTKEATRGIYIRRTDSED